MNDETIVSNISTEKVVGLLKWRAKKMLAFSVLFGVVPIWFVSQWFMESGLLYMMGALCFGIALYCRDMYRVDLINEIHAGIMGSYERFRPLKRSISIGLVVLLSYVLLESLYFYHRYAAFGYAGDVSIFSTVLYNLLEGGTYFLLIQALTLPFAYVKPGDHNEMLAKYSEHGTSVGSIDKANVLAVPAAAAKINPDAVKYYLTEHPLAREDALLYLLGTVFVLVLLFFVKEPIVYVVDAAVLPFLSYFIGKIIRRSFWLNLVKEAMEGMSMDLTFKQISLFTSVTILGALVPTLYLFLNFIYQDVNCYGSPACIGFLLIMVIFGALVGIVTGASLRIPRKEITAMAENLFKA